MLISFRCLCVFPACPSLRVCVPGLNDDVHAVRQPDATVFPDGCGLGATMSTDALFATGVSEEHTRDEKRGRMKT
jgi:hypothetical protein